MEAALKWSIEKGEDDEISLVVGAEKSDQFCSQYEIVWKTNSVTTHKKSPPELTGEPKGSLA